MTNSKIIEGDYSAGSARFVLLVSRFNSFITDSLLSGATDALVRHGVSEKNITVVKVPGAFELPLVADTLAASNKFDAVIALGCVIRGSTAHFDYVAGECAKGIGQVGMKHSLPVVFGVLTTDTIEQAVERAGTKAGNKGADAAMTALELCSLLRKLKE